MWQRPDWTMQCSSNCSARGKTGEGVNDGAKFLIQIHDTETRSRMLYNCMQKSGKYWGPRRNGWAGAVSGGQGQYQVGRGSIDGSTTQVRFSAYRKSSLKCFFGWLSQKN